MAKSKVYFTRDISPDGIKKVYDKISETMCGKVAIKLHTGEKDGPNIIPPAWVKEFTSEKLPAATVVETNTFYDGDRYTTEKHRETLAYNGWNFCNVDILDEDGVCELPVKDGKWFTYMSVGSHTTNYDSLLVLTHFKGHTMGGFGGSNKNIGIGMADGRIGKAMIHTNAGSSNPWEINGDELMERISESSKATVDYFGKNISYINVMRNMSVSCDCEGIGAKPVVTPNVGILSSLDILAIDKASVDMIYALGENDRRAMVERIETRSGLRQLSYMKELGMGSDDYEIIDLDNDCREISPKEAVEGVKPFNS